jgi:predicted short-subunit dehydrogenase-like oxidoreductase (DUF2520 family)
MAKQTRRKPTLSIIGAGRMGGALALSLADKGYRIEALVARRETHARRSSRLLEPRPIALAASQLAALPASDIFLISTPDDVIAPVAQQLANLHMEHRNDRVVLHTSGALSSTILAPLAKVGFKTGSLHPLVSISDSKVNGDTFCDVFFCVEGDRRAVQAGHEIVRALGGRAFSIEPESKALYHAAAVMASGNLTALFDIAIEMLKECGLSGRNARQVLLPLVQSAVTNLASMEPAQALTGTFARGDVTTVRRHLSTLQEHSLAEALAAYVLLGQRSLTLAKQRKLSHESTDQISQLLKRYALNKRRERR